MKMKWEFTRICCMQLQLLNATKYNVESWKEFFKLMKLKYYMGVQVHHSLPKSSLNEDRERQQELARPAASVRWRRREINRGQLCQLETGLTAAQAKCPQGSPAKVGEHPSCAGCWRLWQSAKGWARGKGGQERRGNTEGCLCVASHWDGDTLILRGDGARFVLTLDFILKALGIHVRTVSVHTEIQFA